MTESNQKNCLGPFAGNFGMNIDVSLAGKTNETATTSNSRNVRSNTSRNYECDNSSTNNYTNNDNCYCKSPNLFDAVTDNNVEDFLCYTECQPIQDEKFSNDSRTLNENSNIKYINRNDILVFIDNNNRNNLSVDKLFTIVTSTEEEWCTLKKIFQVKEKNNEKCNKSQKSTTFVDKNVDSIYNCEEELDSNYPCCKKIFLESVGVDTSDFEQYLESSDLKDDHRNVDRNIAYEIVCDKYTSTVSEFEDENSCHRKLININEISETDKEALSYDYSLANTSKKKRKKSKNRSYDESPSQSNSSIKKKNRKSSKRISAGSETNEVRSDMVLKNPKPKQYPMDLKSVTLETITKADYGGKPACPMSRNVPVSSCTNEKKCTPSTCNQSSWKSTAACLSTTPTDVKKDSCKKIDVVRKLLNSVNVQKTSQSSDLETPKKNIKFVNRNDILVFVDDGICNEDSLDKLFTIVTTTETEWTLLKTLFESTTSTCDNSRNSKSECTKSNNYDCAKNDIDIDNSNKANNLEDNLSENNACESSSSTNSQTSQKYNNHLNSVTEKELHSKINNVKGDKTCATDKDFIKKNILSVAPVCKKITTKLIDDNKNIQKPIYELKRCEQKPKKVQARDNLISPKLCKYNLYSKPNSKTPLCRQNSLNCISKSKFGERQTSIVPPDPPERPIYLTHKPQTFRKQFPDTAERIFQCKNARPTPCDKKQETTYQKDYSAAKRSNSFTSSCNRRLQYTPSEHIYAQRSFVDNTSPPKVNALNMRAFREPSSYQTISLNSHRNETPYM